MDETERSNADVLWIRIPMLLGLLDLDPDPLVKGTDPNSSIIRQK
jgi:hypothetical protein